MRSHLGLIFAALPYLTSVLAHTLTIRCENDARVIFHKDDSRTFPTKDFHEIIGRPDSGDGKLKGGVLHNWNEQVFDLSPEFGADLDAKPLFFTVQANAGYPDEKKHTCKIVGKPTGSYKFRFAGSNNYLGDCGPRNGMTAICGSFDNTGPASCKPWPK